jgi:hypothetical protein
MPNFPISEVFEAKQPVVHMPRPEVGQIDFSVDGRSFSFLIPRDDFARLARKISRLLAETPLPVRKRAANPPSSGK